MANMMTPRQEHDRYCRQPEGGWLGDMKPSEGEYAYQRWGHPGDVRRCVHGYLMVGVDVPGLVPCYWRTLHPIWTPVLYWRARKALGPDMHFEPRPPRPMPEPPRAES